MSALYTTAQLSVDDAVLAFPLVSLRHPALTLREWRGTVRRLTQNPRTRGGLMMVRNLRGCVLAVFVYRLREPLVGGIVLRVTDVIMARLPGDALPDAIATAASRLAQEFGHTRVSIEFSEDGLSNDLVRALSQAGFEDGGRLLVRTAASTGSGRCDDGASRGPVAGLTV